MLQTIIMSVRRFFISKYEHVILMIGCVIAVTSFLLIYKFTGSYQYARDATGVITGVMVAIWKLIYSELRLKNQIVKNNILFYYKMIDLANVNISVKKYTEAEENIRTLIALLNDFKKTTPKENITGIDILVSDIENIDLKAPLLSVEKKFLHLKEFIAYIFNNLK